MRPINVSVFHAGILCTAAIFHHYKFQSQRVSQYIRIIPMYSESKLQFFKAKHHYNNMNSFTAWTKYIIIWLYTCGICCLKPNNTREMSCDDKLNQRSHYQIIVNSPVSEGKSVDQSTYLKEKEINDSTCFLQGCFSDFEMPLLTR